MCRFCTSIYPRNDIILIVRVIVFEGMEAVFLSFDTVVAGDINIPPSAVEIGTIPSVEIGSVVAVIAVEDIAGNAVATADGSKKVRIVEADAHAGIEGAADIEILIFGIKIRIVFQIVQHPVVGGFDRFFIGGLFGADFVEECFIAFAPKAGCAVLKSR